MATPASSSEVTSFGSSSAVTSHQTEPNPSLLITTHKLNVIKFLQWSQSVKLFIQGKGKFGYLSGTVPTPTPEDPTYSSWEAENSMLMLWMINSMEPDIGNTHLFLPSTKAVWDSVAKMYSDLGNASQLFDLKNRIREPKQGTHSITHYYSLLISLCQKCDLFTGLAWKCTNDRLIRSSSSLY